MLEILGSYHSKLQQIPKNQQKSLNDIKQNYTNSFIQQITQSIESHFNRYRFHKINMQSYVDTVEYYLKVYEKWKKDENGQDDNESQQPQQIKKLNLYSLFKQIDDKLLFNRTLLEDFRFFCIFPQKSNNQFQQILSKVKILQQKQQQYCKLITSLFDKLNRPPKQQIKLFNQIQKKYANLLNVNANSTTPQLKIKDTFNYIVSALTTYKYLREVEFDIIVEKGIMKDEEYIKLGEGFYQHRFYIKNIKIKIMDMQFCQQKCDALKRYLKKLKLLEKLIIQNYYSECKLGQFVDFNWHPYRKGINIKAGVWK